MVNVYRGTLEGKGLAVGIVVSRFNAVITERLLEGALGRLRALGVEDEAIDVLWVPGAFELPQAAQRMDNNKPYNGLIALGCVIRGGTPHFDHVAWAASRGLAHVAQSSDTPLAFGVLTCDTAEQAQARAGLKSNKGSDAAESLVEMISVFKRFCGGQA